MSSSCGGLPSSCVVELLPFYDLSERSSLVVGAFSLVVLCRLISSCGGCSFLVVTGGSELATGCTRLSTCAWSSSPVVELVTS